MCDCGERPYWHWRPRRRAQSRLTTCSIDPLGHPHSPHAWPTCCARTCCTKRCPSSPSPNHRPRRKKKALLSFPEKRRDSARAPLACECGFEQGPGGPAHGLQGFLAREPGDIGEPDQGFDPDGGAYRVHQATQLGLGDSALKRFERFLESSRSHAPDATAGPPGAAPGRATAAASCAVAVRCRSRCG